MSATRCSQQLTATTLAIFCYQEKIIARGVRVEDGTPTVYFLPKPSESLLAM
jgi:hypothetical protein